MSYHTKNHIHFLEKNAVSWDSDDNWWTMEAMLVFAKTESENIINDRLLP